MAALPQVRFQPYTLPILVSRGPADTSFKLRQLISFPTQSRKMHFVLYLRDFCQARRMGDWAAVPNDENFAKVLEYAAFHRCRVYDLEVKKAPAPAAENGSRRHVGSRRDDDDSDEEYSGCASDAEEFVVEGDISDLLGN